MNNIKDKFNFKAFGLSGVLAAALLLANYGMAKAQDVSAPPPARPDAAQTDRVPPPNEREKPRPRRKGKDEPRPPAPNDAAERKGEMPMPPNANVARPNQMPLPPDRMNERPSQMPPPPNGGVGRSGEMPMEALNAAMEQGLRDGILQAEQDRTNAKGFRPQKSRAYKKATNGFQNSNGDKQFYKDNYRQGFVRGYDRGFGGEMRDGRNMPPPPPAENRSRPERDGARRPAPPAKTDAPPAPPINN